MFVMEEEPPVTECGNCGRAIDPSVDPDGLCDDCAVDPDITGAE